MWINAINRVILFTVGVQLRGSRANYEKRRHCRGSIRKLSDRITRRKLEVRGVGEPCRLVPPEKKGNTSPAHNSDTQRRKRKRKGTGEKRFSLETRRKS